MSDFQPAPSPVARSKSRQTISIFSTSPLVDTSRNAHAQAPSDGVASAEMPMEEASAHLGPSDDNSGWTTDNGYSTNAEQADSERDRPGYYRVNDKKRKLTHKIGQLPPHSLMPYRVLGGVARPSPPANVDHRFPLDLSPVSQRSAHGSASAHSYTPSFGKSPRSYSSMPRGHRRSDASPHVNSGGVSTYTPSMVYYDHANHATSTNMGSTFISSDTVDQEH